MLPTVNTYKSIKEYRTKNAPISFLCDNEQVYFAKYIQATNEFDCLVYELVCSKLAEAHDIHVPEIAFINVCENSFIPEELQNNGNKQYFKPGIVTFGSADIGYCDTITRLSSINGKVEFRKFINPFDMIKISMLDMHVAHKDRWEDNFNLLLKYSPKKDIYAIDHYDTFGGLGQIGKFNEKLSFDINATPLRSDFFFSMIKFMDLDEMIGTIEKYTYICKLQAITALVEKIFNQLPNSWTISDGLKDRIISLLNNNERLNKIEQSCKEFIYVNKQRA